MLDLECTSYIITRTMVVLLRMHGRTIVERKDNDLPFVEWMLTLWMESPRNVSATCRIKQNADSCDQKKPEAVNAKCWLYVLKLANDIYKATPDLKRKHIPVKAFSGTKVKATWMPITISISVVQFTSWTPPCKKERRLVSGKQTGWLLHGPFATTCENDGPCTLTWNRSDVATKFHVTMDPTFKQWEILWGNASKGTMAIEVSFWVRQLISYLKNKKRGAERPSRQSNRSNKRARLRTTTKSTGTKQIPRFHMCWPHWGNENVPSRKDKEDPSERLPMDLDPKMQTRQTTVL